MTDKNIDQAMLMDWANAFRRSRILLTGLELGVFTALGEADRAGLGGLSSADLAARMGTEPRYTDRLLNALVALGLVEKGAQGFRNTPSAAELLDSASPRFQASLLHTCSVYMTWSRLTDVVRQGKPARDLPPWVERPDTRTRHFIGAMQHYGRQRAPQVANQIDLSGVERILDVGGGSGAFCHEFLGRLPCATATLFDLPPVLPLAQQYAQEAGVADRMSFVPGNYNTDALPGNFDLVFMSAIVHINSDEQNRLLVAKGAAALRPGGRLVVRDWIMSPDRTQPAAGALFAINMLVNTDVGDTYTADEVRGWMEAAGLTRVTFLETDDGGGLAVGERGGMGQ